MQVGTRASRHVFEAFQGRCVQLRSWREKAFSRERLAEAALFASTAVVFGYIIWWAARAADAYKILGIG